MSVFSRSSFVLSFFRCVRRQQFSCLESFDYIRTAQSAAAAGTRCSHSWSARCLTNYNTKHIWTSYQRNLSSEAPSKEDEYPPLPEYSPTEETQTKEVFVIRAKGLPWSCTSEDIMSFFSDCRIRGGVQGIHIIHNRNGRPTGQAFIELEHEEDVGKALDQHKQYLGQRYIEVYEVTNKDADAILKATEESSESDGVIRLRGLPFSCTEKDVIQFFSGLQIVEDGVTIILNRKGRNSGDAFVQFATKEMAGKAIERDREVMGNRYIEIFPSRKSEIQAQNGRGRNVTSENTASAMHTSTSHKARTANPVSTTHHSSSKPDNLIHMRGLPYGCTADDIVKFFSPIRLDRVLIEYGPGGRPTGEAEAYFTTHQDAVAAMSKDREYIMERYVELFLNSPPTKEE
ncbi:G-rich sequence factor 1 [Triplophysa rosa]|uniref:G-rich sequence factor 1 n=1 Tax=Triplophysa rosa TaxID=992332 RepID=A0A9W7X3H7_TRIRA|nr:G-rich sequence factor 1 [Triplophysa rosa]KAI7812926.1 putative G-rich sequence factor 1 [Triplophysa rosa]